MYKCILPEGALWYEDSLLYQWMLQGLLDSFSGGSILRYAVICNDSINLLYQVSDAGVIIYFYRG